jgi:hypothetical protein
MDHLSLPQVPWHQQEDEQVSWNAILLSHPIFFDEKWQTIATIVSAVSLQAFLGWL